MPKVVTESFPHFERDENGKLVLVKRYEKGDVIHDEDEIDAVAHQHMHKLTTTQHNPHHCPEDCEELAPPKLDPPLPTPQRQAASSPSASPPSPTPPPAISSPPPSAAPSVSPASEVKS